MVKFLGYLEGSVGYRTYDPKTHKVEVVRAPIFREETKASLQVEFKSNADESDDDNLPSNDTDATLTLGVPGVPRAPPPPDLPTPPPAPEPPEPPPPFHIWPTTASTTPSPTPGA